MKCLGHFKGSRIQRAYDSSHDHTTTNWFIKKLMLLVVTLSELPCSDGKISHETRISGEVRGMGGCDSKVWVRNVVDHKNANRCSMVEIDAAWLLSSKVFFG